MEKDFWKWKIDEKNLYRILFLAGMMLTVLWAIKAYQDTLLLNENELPKNHASEGSYEQEVIAKVGKEKFPLTITVEEKKLSKEEVLKEFEKAEELLPELIKGENEDLDHVTASLNFVDEIPGTAVEVEWVEKAAEYFSFDGERRKEVKLKEPLEIPISAILTCQERAKDYEIFICLLPEEEGFGEKLLRFVDEQSMEQQEDSTLKLPVIMDGKKILWKKPLDKTFLYLPALTVMAIVGLKLGAKRDEEEKNKKRIRQLDQGYAQIVSKFTMLLSAGLSVRNAWERIVTLHQQRGGSDNVVYQELEWGLRELQKGVSELEIYEKFGVRAGTAHYKKLMALFISDKRHGSIRLLDAMNQEMLQAWEEQKRKIRQQGEQIGTKLLIPMMGMLAVVFIMILVPAFLSF